MTAPVTVADLATVAANTYAGVDYLIVERHDSAAQYCPARYERLTPTPGALLPMQVVDAGGQCWQIVEGELSPAMAGAILLTIWLIGQFHGVMRPATPIGSRTIRVLPCISSKR